MAVPQLVVIATGYARTDDKTQNPEEANPTEENIEREQPYVDDWEEKIKVLEEKAEQRCVNLTTVK